MRWLVASVIVAGCAGPLSGPQAFSVNVQFAINVGPTGQGDAEFEHFPGVVVVSMEAVEDSPVSSDLEPLACEGFFPMANGDGPLVTASQDLRIAMIPASGRLGPGFFQVVAQEDAAVARAVVILNGNSADGGSVTLTELPESDAGTYVGSFTATFGGQALTGQFSAPFCSAILTS